MSQHSTSTLQNSSSILRQIETLEELLTHLLKTENFSQKLKILNSLHLVINFLKSHPKLRIVNQLGIKEQFVIKALIAVGQGPIVFQNLDSLETFEESLKTLISQLLEIEKFYDVKGGIVGYHLTILKLLYNRDTCQNKEEATYEMPHGLDISKESKELDEALVGGISLIHQIGEIYPLGGAGDRLNLKDEMTGELLPAAQLLFCGRTLLELLIRDLWGREFLHYKLYGKQQKTPIAIMTSHEKKNHKRVLELCEGNHWFGRSKEHFRFFIQPLVPMLTIDGEWAVSNSMELILKPGGHGVIWKAAIDNLIFDWFEKHERKKILVRQINNPVGGIDVGLLALCGIGCLKNKDFGFASCQRLVGAAEGMDVLKEVPNKIGYTYCITNIEYTEFKQFQIEDEPVEQGNLYSRFPANTNILFGDISAIKEALNKCSIPGILINLKSRVNCLTADGIVEKYAGRMESTMQNIADYIVDSSPKKLSSQDCGQLRTFLTYNERKKTISVVKQSYVQGKPINDTPEGAFYDLMLNYRDLLENHCKMILPKLQSENDYLANGPDWLALFHPALGPLYSVIGQKIKGGRVGKNSELILEISEIEIEDLDLEGSLIIEAEAIMGAKDHAGDVIFNHNASGKCVLKHVKVKNEGREKTSGFNAWRCEGLRKEALHIYLEGNAEFFAENVEFQGVVDFNVPSGHRLIVYQRETEISWYFEKIDQPSWNWEYIFDEESKIKLTHFSR